MEEKNLEEQLKEKNEQIKALEEKNLELSKLLEEQATVLIELRQENEELQSKQDVVSQEILTKIYISLSEVVSKSSDNQDFSQEHVSNFCVVAANRFGLKHEPYTFIKKKSSISKISHRPKIEKHRSERLTSSERGDKSERSKESRSMSLRLNELPPINKRDTGAESAREFSHKGRDPLSKSSSALKEKSHSFSKKSGESLAEQLRNGNGELVSPKQRKYATKMISLDSKALPVSGLAVSTESDRKHSERAQKILARNSKSKTHQNDKVPVEEEKRSSPSKAPIASKAIRSQIDINEIREKTTQAWSLPIRSSHLFGDLCRLSTRISFTDNRSGKEQIDYSPPDEIPPIQCAKELLKQVIKALETEEVYKSVENVLNQADTASDGALWVSSVFDTLGDESHTGKFLMGTHQGIITGAASQIKVVFFSLTNQFPKDVQGKEGWRIKLLLTDEQVLVSHHRKELAPGENGYSFEWEISTFLNPTNFRSIEKITFSGSNLQIANTCSPDFKQRIQDCFDQLQS